MFYFCDVEWSASRFSRVSSNFTWPLSRSIVRREMPRSVLAFSRICFVSRYLPLTVIVATCERYSCMSILFFSRYRLRDSRYDSTSYSLKRSACAPELCSRIFANSFRTSLLTFWACYLRSPRSIELSWITLLALFSSPCRRNSLLPIYQRMKK